MAVDFPSHSKHPIPPMQPRSPSSGVLAQALDGLAGLQAWTYGEGQPSAAEPAAIVALALAAHQRLDDAQAPATWLAQIQQANGAVGLSADEPLPAWPTSLALLAWSAWISWDDRSPAASPRDPFASARQRAASCILAQRGETGEQKPQIGHDVALQGWSWAERTHSWLEPTCCAVLALKRSGHAHHSRTRQGVKLIVDRLLDSGGANYGNTWVLGQQLLPHVQPTGLALLALADESVSDPRIPLALDWLGAQLGPETPAASLSYALFGLSAWRRRPAEADAWIEGRLLSRLHRSHRALPSPYRTALLVWAAASGGIDA